MVLQIPITWKKTGLSEITEINMGQSPDGSTVNESGDGIVFFQGKSEFGKIHPTPRKYCTKPKKIAKKGDVLLSVRAPVGPTNIAVQTTAIGRGLAAIRAIDGYSHPKFLLYYFRHIEPWLSEQGTGSTFKAISGQFIQQLEIAIPPFSEQKIIAEKLDTLLTQVDSIKAHLGQITLIIKKFRQSVLAAAVNGKLTEGWRGFGHIIQHSNYSNWLWKEIPKEWEIDTYERLVESRLGKMLDKAKNSGIPTKYLGNINVRWFSFQMDELQEIQVSNDELNELALKNGDILICEGGEPGRAAIWKGENATTPIIFQKALHRARVCSRITPEWLLINLKNDADNKTLEQLFTGTTIKHLTGKALKKYPLKVPPLEEQTEIVRRVEQLFTYADGVEKQVQNALERVNNLTQSILAKAFRGELTAQWRAENPELISGENSAEALLARIKAERAAQQPQKKTRQKANAAG
ncbi:restriction endonuclease subunit S [Dickeya oryzae]|uniref:restriction endonuclease subunit S n=1 Tax=Dickeya oryzae TaxID=1240404 RepID=UPI001AECCB8D|nr:restriction endonuclease subunit S [Dickeya oryzae]MBP2847611.1 restriction endonuclease subunit S [Dickeya oryzae]